jgi:tRNA modification GTPase
MMLDDTIAAVSTPLGEGAIAIVRMSGPQAIAIADKVFAGKTKLSEASSHSLHHGKVIDPGSGQAFDEVLVSMMRAPATYTAEDMVEINCHGGILVTQKILGLLLETGARLATSGEFTRRAFLNGRMDLAQAEAIVDIIRSKADLSLKIAIGQLSGGLSEAVGEIRKNLLEALALVEAELDFSDQGLEVKARDQALLPLEKAERIASRLLRGGRIGQQLREGFTVVILGRPNVGKSSLFNALLKMDRAIVTDIAGTTRDTISEETEIEGVPVRLVDTAGLHAGCGLVEKEGVRRARNQMDSADLLLVLLDGSEPLCQEDRQILRETEDRTGFVVINKIDLPKALDMEVVESLAAAKLKIYTSAQRGDGLENLARAIGKELLNSQGPDISEPMVSRLRHQEALKRAAENIGRARRGLSKGVSEELVAIDLREALSAVGQITGEVYSEEILDRIFAQFCVGK